MSIKEEITFELTNYCEHSCAYCSSETTRDFGKAEFISMSKIQQYLEGVRFKRIILSGGEPLAHPDFYKIYCLCRDYADDVVVYTNLLRHISYNVNIHDGVYVEAALNISSEVQKVRILRRINQGRERTRPEVTLSKNFGSDCNCGHNVIRSDGKVASSPCKKFSNKVD